MNSLLTEIRNAFGFPQLIPFAPQEQEQKSNAQPRNYTINNGDEPEDYFDQLGAAV